jgi:uncharacterized membrane protein
MKGPQNNAPKNNNKNTGGTNSSKFLDGIRRAFKEFLTIPTCIIVSFFLLATGMYLLDRTEVAWLVPLNTFMKAHVFSDAKATSDLLSTIAGGIITVTSITISLLLIAVQQTSNSMTSHVFDQFLRRWHNQVYFGFFVGLALYSLVTLATVAEPFNPVFGATLAVLLTVVALYLLLLLFYTTINQMRPIVVIEAIHDYVLAARKHQLQLIRKTRRSSDYESTASLPIKATRHGFVTHVNIDAIDEANTKLQARVEVILLVTIGSYVAYQDVIATIKACTLDNARKMENAVQAAIHLERQRDIATDPAYGIEQLEMIAWVSISTAQSNPLPGLLTIRALRDVMARWSADEHESPGEAGGSSVVCPDNAFSSLMDAFESLAVVSSESMQHQNFTEVVHTFAITFSRLPPDQQRRVEDLILRIISALGDHVLTSELDTALSLLVSTLNDANRLKIAHALSVAQEKLGLSVGKLNSRSTRAPRTAT